MDQSLSVHIINFNSIKVQLELHKELLKMSFLIHFNSIKVQLELTVEREEGDPQVFQFHKGTIRTLTLEVMNIFVSHFNSIKVQLELLEIPHSILLFLISIP